MVRCCQPVTVPVAVERHGGRGIVLEADEAADIEEVQAWAAELNATVHITAIDIWLRSGDGFLSDPSDNLES